MSAFITSALATLVLFATSAETSVSSRMPDCSTAVRLDLSVDSQAEPTALCITPDLPTTLVFDTPLPPEAIELQPSTPSLNVAQGVNFVTVYAKRGFLHGERIKFTVHFGPTSAPTRESFWLMGHVARGVRQVEVFRHPRPVEALERQVRESRLEARACREDNARLMKEKSIPRGLVNVAWLEQTEEVKFRNDTPRPRHHSGSALTTVDSKVYTHASQWVISLQLTNQGLEGWTAAGAMLSEVTGEQQELPVWQESAIPASGRGFVLVGPARNPEQLACPCQLKLWDGSGQRVVTYEDVTFSQLEPSP